MILSLPQAPALSLLALLKANDLTFDATVNSLTLIVNTLLTLIELQMKTSILQQAIDDFSTQSHVMQL